MNLKVFSDYEVRIIDYYLDLLPNNKCPISGNGKNAILKLMDKHDIELPSSYLRIADTTNKIIDILPKYSVLDWDKISLFLAYEMLNRDELIGWWHEVENQNIQLELNLNVA